MATVTSSGSALASAAQTTSTSSRNEIAGNFQDFLLLLTTQLQNQSPLDPLDTNQFTQQLVQFAGVEQQLKGNDTLGSILSAVKSTSTANAASYLGMTVTADGSSAPLANGAASWTINPAKAAAKATVTIKNSSGEAVLSKSTTLKAGSQSFTWDGRNTSGLAQPDGTYTIAVAGTDASGQPITVSTEISGTVSAVDVSGTAPALTVGTSVVPLSSVKRVAYAQ